jgi:hypothetical protein
VHLLLNLVPRLTNTLLHQHHLKEHQNGLSPNITGERNATTACFSAER